MIKDSDITSAGTFTKTHGLKGELHALLDIDAEFFSTDPCFIVEIDGIYVPFFAESVRPKGHYATLIKPEDVNSEPEAKLFVGKKLYIRKQSLLKYEQAIDEQEDGEGGYADDFIGYRVLTPAGDELGEITDLETTTANTLFILRTPQDKTLYIPVAQEFVVAIDPEAKNITMQLPEGLVDLN